VDVLEPQRERLRESDVSDYFVKGPQKEKFPNALIYNLDESNIMGTDRKVPVYWLVGYVKA